MSEPRINATLKSFREIAENDAQRVLLVNTSVSGALPTGKLYTNIGNDLTYVSDFGFDSRLTRDITAFKALNPLTRLDVVSLAGTGAAATGSIDVNGVATAAGEITLTLASRRDESYTFKAAAGDLANDIVTDFYAQITGQVGLVPQLVRASGFIIGPPATLQFTATEPGAVGNSYGIEISGRIPGISITLAPMSGGTGTPVLTSVPDLLGDTRYQTVVAPYEFGAGFLTGLLDPRFNVANNILDGVGLMTITDTLANITIAAAAQDSTSLVLFANKKITETLYAGPHVMEAGHVVSASVAAIRSLRLTEGANISSIVVATQSSDQIGGAAIAGLPYANTPYVNLPTIDAGKGWTLAEEMQLNAAGAAVFTNSRSGTVLLQGRVVSTYKTDVLGAPDETFKFLNAVDVSSAIREFYFDQLKLRFAQSRLTLGDVEPNRAMTNPQGIAAFCVLLYQRLGSPDFVLVQAGAQSINFYKSNLNVKVLDLAIGSVQVSMKVLLVSQLRSIELPIEVTFTTF